MIDATSVYALPKAELHLHIEGTLEPELVFAAAERNDVALPWASVDELRAAYQFENLQSFLDLYYQCMSVLRTRQDFAELAETYLRRAGAQGLRHVEMFFDLQAHTTRGVAVDDVIDGLLDGFARVRGDLDISGGLILCFLRDSPVDDAMAALESVTHRLGDILGVGLDSAEVGYPPSLFEGVFARAAELGLHRVAHAGEEGPAGYIWEALEALGVERVDHGVKCLEDDALVARLRDEQVPLTVCPLSTLRLAGVPSLDVHPLPRLIAAGLLTTINSDDPSYFGGYVGENYVAVAEATGLTDADLRAQAQNSIRASFAPEERKAQLLAELAALA